MQTIGPIQGSSGNIVTPTQLGGTGPAAQNASAAAGMSSAAFASQTLTMQSSMTRITQVSSRVDTMLTDLGIDPQSNEMLRMIIGLLILQLLLGADGNAPESGRNLLGQLSAGGRSSELIMFESSTSTLQIESQTLSAESVVQSLSGAGSDASGGERIDLSA